LYVLVQDVGQEGWRLIINGPHICYHTFFGGEHRRIYNEVRLEYIISDHHNPSNHSFYSIEDEIGSFVFHLNDDEPEITVSKCINESLRDHKNEVWKMYLDGYSSKEGFVAGIVLISPALEVTTLSYKLEFETTNNTVE
jgi:hypothetical protein